MKFSCTMALTVAALTASATAQWGQELKPGSEAPKLDVERWVLGEPVSAFETGNVYLVEFWATWCAPCKAAIPILNMLQREFEPDGLVVIGVSTDEKLETVQNYVAREAGRIRYRIAFDGGDTTKRAWMGAARQEGIPVSFVVDRAGKIQYIGNPHDEDLPYVIQLVLQDRYDAKLFKDAAPSFEAFREARRLRNFSLAYRHLDDIINLSPRVFAFGHLEKFEIKMVDRDSPEEAYEHARKILEDYAGDAQIMIDLARTIVTDPQIKPENRDLDIAMKAAKQAQVAGRPNDPAILATLALVHFHQGNVNEAISLQRRAWMIATPSRKPYLERDLRSYQEAAQRSARLQSN